MACLWRIAMSNCGFVLLLQKENSPLTLDRWATIKGGPRPSKLLNRSAPGEKRFTAEKNFRYLHHGAFVLCFG